MAWYVALYLWGVVASSIVNNTKSLLALWYISKYDKQYLKEFKERSGFEKASFFARNILKTFIPVYNIIHPLVLLANSRFPNLLHPIDSLISSGGNQYAIWKNKENKRMKRINKLVQKINKFFGNDKVENKTTKSVPSKQVPERKPVSQTQNKKQNPPLPERKPVVQNNLQTKKPVSTASVDSEVELAKKKLTEAENRINSLRSQYNKLNKEYNALKKQGAPKSGLLITKKKMDEIADNAQGLIEAYNGLKQRLAVRTSGQTKKPVETIESIDAKLESLKNEQAKLIVEYNSLAKAGKADASKLSRINAIRTEVQELLAKRNQLFMSQMTPSDGQRTLRR